MSGILLGIVGATFSSPPVNTVAPAVTGTASVGETLTSSTGTWTGAGITYSYQWQHTTTNISGATSSTYVIEVAYVGETIRCVVTATSSSGASSANSNATSAVAAAAASNLWAWGNNAYGKLGLGDTVNRSSPVQVGSLGTWFQVSAGSRMTSAVKTNGTLWAWGTGQDGVLGQQNITSYSSPKQVGALTSWAVTASGNPSIGAIKTNGTLWSWGRNGYGELGQGNTAGRSSPVQVGSLETWSKIAAGTGAMAAITTGGTLWTWGRNYAGGLGLGDKIDRSSPVQVGILTNWSTISVITYPGANYKAFIAVKTDGTMWSWGKNSGAQLGVGNGSYNSVDRSSPTQIGSATTWGVGNLGSQFGFAIKTTGSLWTWGTNYSGDQADNRTLLKGQSGPIQVGLLTDWWSTTNKASAGGRTGLAIKSDGTFWNWGKNDVGQLGKNDTANTSSPVQLGSLTTWTSVSASDISVLAIAGH